MKDFVCFYKRTRMKKFASLVMFVAVAMLAACGGSCGPCGKKSKKKPAHRSSKMVKKAPAKKSMGGSVRSEVDKLWSDVKKI